MVRKGKAAADEVDDFEAVTFVERSFRPAVARHDVAIQLNSHAVRLHAEGFDQRRQGEGRLSFAESAFVPVEVKFHFGIAVYSLMTFSRRTASTFCALLRNFETGERKKP